MKEEEDTGTYCNKLSMQGDLTSNNMNADQQPDFSNSK